MTGHVRDLAVAAWRVTELIESLTPEDLADLSTPFVMLHLQSTAAELEDRVAEAVKR